jgi:hypothetical protein
MTFVDPNVERKNRTQNAHLGTTNRSSRLRAMEERACSECGDTYQ